MLYTFRPPAGSRRLSVNFTWNGHTGGTGEVVLLQPPVGFAAVLQWWQIENPGTGTGPQGVILTIVRAMRLPSDFLIRLNPSSGANPVAGVTYPAPIFCAPAFAKPGSAAMLPLVVQDGFVLCYLRNGNDAPGSFFKLTLRGRGFVCPQDEITRIRHV